MNQIISILNSFKEIITFENITFLLGLIGSAGTAWQVIKSRKNIDLFIVDYAEKTVNGKTCLIIHTLFSNKSNAGVSIFDVSVKINDIYYPCTKEPQLAVSNAHQRLGQVLIQDFYSPFFPLQMAGLGGTYAYLTFELEKGIHPDFSKPLILRVSTNRGKAIEKILSYPPKYSK